MAKVSAVSGERGRSSAMTRLRGWTLWTTPRVALTLIVSVELAAVICLTITSALTRPTTADMWRFVLLLGIATAYAELGDRVDRMRRYLSASNGTGGNPASLWCLAAAFTLPIGLAGGFAALVYVHALLRAHRHQAAHPHRLTYTGATEVLATFGAAGVISALDPHRSLFGDGTLAAVAVVLAILTYAVINQVLVSSVVYVVVRPERIRSAMLTPDDLLLELATLCLAALLAATVLHAPLLAPLSLVLIIVLRRSSLVRQLQQQATRDPKTGLLNAGAWRDQAERELARDAREARPVSVLMIDLDHFKTLNDTYGHQAGDATLKAVASCLTDALRGYDAVGRYGGEEFVALLSEVDELTCELIAHRLGDRIRALTLAHDGGVTASIGVAYAPEPAGLSLDELIVVADRAMYAAKGAGRDRVVLTGARADVNTALSRADRR
jgi:diguanylate cyclase (GGDEF)-like protein